MTCPHCSGYGTILLHDQYTDEESESMCTRCLGTGRGALLKPPDPQKSVDLEKELDAVAERVKEHFGD